MLPMRALLIGVATLVAMLGTARAETELKNDSFVSGQAAGFQAGFITGEMGASRFIAPEAGRQVLKVQLLFGGGSTATQTVTLKIFDDTAGTNAPGGELFTGEFSLMGSDQAIHELVLPAAITVPMQFRVAVQFMHNGAPSIARDNDGLDAAKNYIFAPGAGGWFRSQTLGLTGDWVIRAIITDGGVAPVDGAPGDAGVVPGGDCSGNPDCPTGQFCESGSCTFDCRMDDDCGGGTCNSLGQCVGGESDGGGCCRTDRGGAVGAGLLGLAVLGLVLRRRRQCCG
jgi:MYXO-CTERM domain-containing protein